MKCAVLLKPGHMEIRDLERPETGPGEILIEVELAGICGSDDSIYHGKSTVPLPIVPGHEAVGRVVSMGEGVKGFKAGQRVTIQPNFSCGRCELCLSGLANVCRKKIRLGLDIDGVFGQYVKVPFGYAWPLPDSMENETAVFAEPLAVALHALRKARPKKGQRVLVLGAGVIGLLLVQLLILENESDVLTFDLVRERLSLSEEMGASAGIDSMDRISDEGPFGIIFETSGAPGALAHAVDLASPGGRIIALGLPGSGYPLFTTTIVRKELSVFGSMIYTGEFPAVLDILEKGEIMTKPLISGIVGLEELPAALERFSSPTRVKTLVRIG